MSVRSALLASVCSAFLAVAAAQTGLAAASDSPSVNRAQEGFKSLAAGQSQDAISAFSEAIESRDLPPDILAGALLNRGLAYQQTGEFQEAIDDYTAALHIDALGAKLRASALYNRGLAYQQVKKPALAVEDFTSALFLDPEFPHAYYSRGNALRDSGQYLFALSDYDKALRYKHPQPQLVYYSQALTYEALHRPESAQESLNKSLAVKPDFDLARKRLTQLGGTPPVAPPIEAPVKTADDAVVTGSIVALAAGDAAKKPDLPVAVAPPKKLVGMVTVAKAPDSQKRKKLYTDRIPAAVEEAALSVTAAPVPAPEKPAQKPAVKEKIVAVETLPEDLPETAPAKSSAPPPAVAETEPQQIASTDEQPEPASSGSEPLPKGWSVQISSQRDEDAAWNVWKKMKIKYKVLADQRAFVVKADLGNRGVVYRLRLAGFDDQDAAKGVCSKLKSRGVSCFVSKVDS